MRVNTNPPPLRRPGAADRLLGALDRGLRAVAGPAPRARRPNPADAWPEADLEAAEVRAVARLMRVDHAGEVAAQALYEGQALTARDAVQAADLRRAALEEADHLAWCAARLDELGQRPSRLGPFWYLASLGIGAAAGLAGDRWSLGFLSETERQVEKHLEEHLQRLPPADRRSRAILEQMKTDEVAHAVHAEQAGARRLPAPVRLLMHLTSRVMTIGAARL